jgi:hypothetical protein
MTREFHHITVKFVPDIETGFNKSVIDKSLFLKAAYSLDASRIVAPLSPDIKKDESLGHLWHDVTPTEKGYTFELATELQYYLPNLKSNAEFILNVEGNDLFICNRMVRAFTGQGYPKNAELKYFLTHQLALPSIQVPEAAHGLYPIPIKTFISRQFISTSKTAEDAVDMNFIAWREELIGNISKLVDAFRSADPQRSKHLLPLSAISSFPIFWLVICGTNGKLACEQFAGEVGLAALRPLLNIEDKSVERIENILKDKYPITPYEVSLGLANTFNHYGYCNLALIHLCTACETLLSTKLRLFLQSKGISKNHLDKYFDDITFSQLLNLHLPSFGELTKLNDYQEILGKLNWARQRRNEIVHLGVPKTEVSTREINEAIEAATVLFKYLNRDER